MDAGLHRGILILALMFTIFAAAQPAPAADKPATFTVSFTKAQSNQPIDGRLLLLLSTDPSG
jgi:hypothetical protein